LQDQEVAVEVRLVRVSEDFFDRIGINFNAPIRSTRPHPSLMNNSFVTDLADVIRALHPPLLGLTPAGSPRAELDTPVSAASFYSALPAPGDIVASASPGLAFLSDPQVFLFMETLKNDPRASILEVSKMTLFNGGRATLYADTRSFGRSEPVVLQPCGAQFGGFGPIPPSNADVDLAIQAVISTDQRLVRLWLSPTLTNEIPGPIETCPSREPIRTAFDGTVGEKVGEFTRYLHEPTATTEEMLPAAVVVPDGGTVVLGGLKRLSKVGSEYGPAMLSKVPSLKRLLEKIGDGWETEHLLILVTPRIITQEETEERQEGFVRPVAGNLP
jgi:hypothetical protein